MYERFKNYFLQIIKKTITILSNKLNCYSKNCICHLLKCVFYELYNVHNFITIIK